MTLIIGVKCDEGCVVGADSAATLGTSSQLTIRQSCSKIDVIADRVIMAVSGPIGLAQRLAGEVESAWNQNAFKGLESWQVMTNVRARFWSHISAELTAAQVAQSVVPGAAQGALTHSVLAMPVRNRPCLFQFDAQGAPEEASADLPFVCAGSGMSLADPFMAFLKEVFWEQGRPPSVAAGVFAVLWAMRQVIDIAPGFVDDPIQIFTLQKQDGDWRARRLGEDELEEQKQAIDAAKDALRNFADALQPSADNLPPLVGNQSA